MRKALGAEPFGNPKDLAKPAQTAAGWFLAKSQDLQKQRVLAEDGVALLKEIAGSGTTELHDYDSARQLVWALQVVTGDLKGSYPNAAKVAPLLKSMDETFVLDMRHSRTGTDAEATLQGGKLASARSISPRCCRSRHVMSRRLPGTLQGNRRPFEVNGLCR